MPEEPKPNPVKHERLGAIYANPEAMIAIRPKEQTWEITMAKSVVFQVGSIFVREKLSPKDSKPELLAVMIKRAPGYNPDGGDWQFLLTDANKKKVKLNQKTGECLNCHHREKGNDFVYPVTEVMSFGNP